MQIERLRLHGFKSFVDAAELPIAPGLTGIVGPNGCGKSNLAEALRWVMGETSARRLRGGAMDDVIFAGSAGRPARNLAEVALTLDNSARDAPSAFNDRDEIEIVRRIERGGGSAYRINGGEARARDVQLLFADAASGAQSGALISQGRIGALIEAKPAERRLLLEEAAGTTGLQARRRETEQRLDAAEANLSRLDDVIATIQAQFETLRGQARRAQRYRRLAEQIRRTEAVLLHARLLAANTEAQRVGDELRAADEAVAELTERTQAERARREAVEGELPPLRRAEAEAAAELQRLTHARDGLEQELLRVLSARGEAERRLGQLAADRRREEELLADAEGALARLAEERRTLDLADAEDGPAREAAAAALREASAALADAEAALQQAAEAAASLRARKTALEQQGRDLDQRDARLRADLAEAERERAALVRGVPLAAAVAGAAAALAEAERRAGSCRAAAEAGEPVIAARWAEESAALDAQREADAARARLEAEAEALTALLAALPEAEDKDAILSEVRVEAGFEAAVGAVFADELGVPPADRAGAAAAGSWLDLPAIESPSPLPAGARPLAAAVTAPHALGRRLAFAGWVERPETGRALQPRLAPGQRLVDRDGRLWRWDGFARLAPRPSPAAQRLRQRNRLALLGAQIAGLDGDCRAAAANAAAARSRRERAVEADRLARARLSEAEAGLACAREAAAALARQRLTAEARLAAVADAIGKLTAERAELAARAERAAADLAAVSEAEPQTALDAARAATGIARRREAASLAAAERLDHAAGERGRRRAAAIADERRWREHAAQSSAQRRALDDRQGAVDRDLAELGARPAAIAAESETLAADIAGAAIAGRRAADALTLGEARLREAGDAARLAERSLSEAREGRARLEARRDGASEARARLEREVRERLDAPPEALAELAGLAPGEAPPDPAETAARLARLARERDGLGPVNLVAEREAAAAGARLSEMRRERDELTQAIARLRRGLAALDAEGRQRLGAAFAAVNGHFAALFTRLFGGGRAQLALVEGADPLAAGLEIMASPPGKRLQSLSLLSGGEQALTALALTFAVFLTKPAPVCVLDEVDAALDDANVDRFCRLVAEIADTAGTRFLVVTHHRITMARVDRLFGVTMAERGVSQLVSVDFARAAALRQSA
jgi:chromosome segregation protein